MSSLIPTKTSDSCCAEISPISKPDEVVNLLKALADPTRLKLLYMVAEQGCDNVCGCDLATAMGVSAPTITHHMKKLVAAGLVKREQRGKWAFFSINKELFGHIKVLIDAVQPHASRTLLPAG